MKDIATAAFNRGAALAGKRADQADFDAWWSTQPTDIAAAAEVYGAQASRLALAHVEVTRTQAGWLVSATYANDRVTFAVEKEHPEYGAAVASLVNDTPGHINVKLAP